jgi:deoxyribonuclease V
MSRPPKIRGTKSTGGAVRTKRTVPPLFDLTVPNLEAELIRLLAQIPAGQVTTYGDLADALGLRSAARWVGEFLRDHQHSVRCPCHRVVRKGGELGLYLRDRKPAEKADKLRREGIEIENGVVEQFDTIVFRDFESERPLAGLIELQHEIADRVCLETWDDAPAVVAGLDVSYARDGAAVGACALVETDTGSLVWSATRRQEAPLPYIPSLLTFRELPVLLALFNEARRRFPELSLFVVDGNGILHPRGAGVATCFGVVADVPTIGVAKSLLCGRLEERAPTIEGCCPISMVGKTVGAVFKRQANAHRLYVSPGHQIDLAGTVQLIRLLDFGHRLPEPLYWADRLSRAEARRVSADSHL